MDIYSEKKAMKDLNSLYAEAVYGKPKSAGQELASREKNDNAAGAPKKMVVTRADKKANTKAYQNYKAGVKGYAAADHLKNEEYAELVASIQEKEGYKTVAAVIDYDRSKKGTDDATYDSEHGEKKKAKKERDYAAWEREKMKKDDPNWKHKKGSTSESFSSWRDDLSEVLVATETEVEKEVKETKVKNKVVIDPEIKLEQALGGKVEAIEEKKDCCEECGSYDHVTADCPQRKIKEEILLDKAVVALSELEEMIGIDEAQTAYEKARKAAARRAADRNAARKRGELGGRMERETYTNEAGKEMHYKGYSA